MKRFRGLKTNSIRACFGACASFQFLVTGLLLVLPACDGQAPTGNFSAAPMAMGESDTAAAAAREIEEADVVKVVGSRVFVLNRIKGLVIIDAADPAAPAIVGHLPLSGRGVEMYVVGQQIFALLSADYYYPYAEGGGNATALSIAPPGPGGPAPEFDGSRLAIIDVADAASPKLLGKINLVGFATTSRRVGDVIYVIGRNFVPYVYDAAVGANQVDEGFVASVNIADPANIVPVQRKTFSGEGLEMHATQTLILVAGGIFDANTSQTMTRVQAVDISDPAGVIAVRGAVDVPGFIRTRFYMDVFEDVLRIATESNGFGFQSARLFTFNLADPDAITPLGQVEVIQGESLEAVRFDGPRGYLVTFLRVDPLFVVDLRDPAAPAVTGHLEVPGFSTHLEPRGERLIAVGVDDTNGRRPAVSYYDVSDPAAPTELGRVILGPPGSFTESEAVYDDKAFKVVDALGLIAVPFQHVAEDAGGGGNGGNAPGATAFEDGVAMCVNAVQLVDFDDAALTARGWFEHEGRVERVGDLDGRIFSLSQAAFQLVDITNRDAPTAAGVAAILTNEEKTEWGVNDCGYVFWGPIDPGFGVFPFWGGLCGIFGFLPLAGTFVGLLWLGYRSRLVSPRSRR